VVPDAEIIPELIPANQGSVDVSELDFASLFREE
jgi:hypothetical protein